jgi:hypothetical protein
MGAGRREAPADEGKPSGFSLMSFPLQPGLAPDGARLKLISNLINQEDDQ